MNTNDAKEYLARREIPQLFESLLTGLMYHRPDDPVDYLEGCLKKVRELGGPDMVRWDTFVGQEKKPLPPLNGGQSRRSLFRNVMPDSPNFPYRRYERLPPISQFSIESDSDLSETAELIEEYEVFDPSRPRPKVILVIGGPGSGKGTQCLKIAERYGFQYVSVGELLRKKMIHNATSNRKWSLIAKIITNGELAPQETTITEIKQKIMKIPDANGIVIDGFPRDVGQALSFEDQICTPDVVLFLACTNHRLKERLQRRAEQQGRPDDNPKAIDRRLTNFKQNTIPLVKYFQERGLIVTLDADRDENEVFCDISATLDNKLFPSQESAAGPSELDPNLLPVCNMVDFAGKNDEDEEEEELRYTEGSEESFCTQLKKPQVIFLMGGAGSGKRVQCEHMVDKLGLRRVSLADLLCSEMQTDSDSGRHLRDVLQKGEPLPEDVTMDLLCEAVAAAQRQAKGVVVCGFPVDLRQAQLYEAKIDAERSPDEVFAQICQVVESPPAV
ncbi:adenylate kinase isoenzyme 5 isoform X2 [Phycodurus eques]|uniref:adenylate kinase isoenzyme 5 isoform X2 n=1 Tax=Phycodurus eques TaxID=693459 RepID=UPI002ACD9C1D|nr:adenylate kinase isoenzyme 5 isoform X2 [Phycodurus eques]